MAKLLRRRMVAATLGMAVMLCIGKSTHHAALGADTTKALPTNLASPAGRRDSKSVSAAIDAEISKALAAARIPESLPASDSDFIRRATLDITGRIPTAQRAMAFAADRRPDKRERLLDELLDDRDYGVNFGTIWYHLLVTPNDDNRKLVRHAFADWLAEQFNKNRGWDAIVTEILTASGGRNDNPATVFWFAHTLMDGKQAKLKPQEAMASATQRFLGTQYQCAECHNHPFTGFPQSSFWSMAAFFGQVDFQNAGKKTQKKGNEDPDVREGAAGAATIEIPEKAGVHVSAKFPDGAEFAPGGDKLRVQFARWCTAPQNDAFARAAMNRMWAHFFGRGIVEPVDDLRDENEPTHPEVLRLLGEEFKSSGYDLKHMIRCICGSQAYQRSSETSSANAADDKLVSHMPLKALSPEVMLRSLCIACGQAVAEEKFTGKEGKKQKNTTEEGKFIANFNTSQEPDLPEYSHGVPQVLRLMNGSELEQTCPTIEKLVSVHSADGAKVVEGLYWAALSRPPRPAERQKMAQFVAASRDRQKAYRDILWALLNSGEFVLNH